ncbi:polysaccharide deacetylase family protein [Streptomyces sp. NBC_01294]|uniref:polysaccharide deacetylase family protein n=1 Tax=Streptomyces sp. NBC_01294 TaxID=2903815 RepID=UPI00308E6C24|nr:polysaccharide deacetylase family protein [Streptomyces sp. NBC_01294]
MDTVLTELRRRRLPATFFPTGDFADAHPAAVRAIGAAHGLGNHSYSHPHFAANSAPRSARTKCAAPTRRSGRRPGPSPCRSSVSPTAPPPGSPSPTSTTWATRRSSSPPTPTATSAPGAA